METTPSFESRAEPSVAFYALGCKANQLESSALADEFKSHGWAVLPFDQKASVYVINTCTVTEDGDRESRRIIRKAKRINPEARVAVTGCYAQVASDAVAAIEGVNYVIGNNFKQDIYRIVTETPVEETPYVLVSEMDKSRILAAASSGSMNRTRASLKIQDGCDYKCTYCIIWVARGPSRSVPLETLVAQTEALVASGHHEIVLTGIDISQYQDPQSGLDLTGLVRTLAEIPGDFRLRLSSLDPADVSSDLIAVVATHPKVCAYLHLSAQSAQDEVLKRMARRHRVRDLVRITQEALALNPRMAIGADIIAGFPGETAAQFESTVETLESLPWSYFHTFTYSPRSGTPAAGFDGPVPDAEKKARTHRLLALSHQKNLHYRQRMLGQTVCVIVEDSHERGMCEYFVPISLESGPYPANTQLTVTVTRIEPEQTWGVALA